MTRGTKLLTLVCLIPFWPLALAFAAWWLAVEVWGATRATAVWSFGATKRHVEHRREERRLADERAFKLAIERERNQPPPEPEPAPPEPTRAELFAAAQARLDESLAMIDQSAMPDPVKRLARAEAHTVFRRQLKEIIGTL